MKKLSTLLASAALILSFSAPAQIISTIAGSDGGDDSTSGLPALTATLVNPWAIAVDDLGNVYVSEPEKCRVRKIDASGNITTVAGNGTPGYSGDSGPATDAQLKMPYGIAIGHSGYLYIADHDNSVIRMVSPLGIITTIAGEGVGGYSGDGGPARSAQLNSPYDVALDQGGNLYIADAGNNAVRKINTSGIISNVINGFSFSLSPGGEGYTGSLWFPSNPRLSGIALDGTGNLYIADYWDNIIRKVTPSGSTTTIAGNPLNTGYGGDGGLAIAARLCGPKRIAVDDTGNIIFSDHDNYRVRKIDALGDITTIAGNGNDGFIGDNGMAVAATVPAPIGITCDHSGNLFIIDNGNKLVRKVRRGNVGVKQIPPSNSIALTPNPNKGAFSIKGEWNAAGTEKVSIEVMDMTGKVVYKNTVAPQNGNIDAEISLDAPAGTYVLKMSTSQTASTLHFVIEK